MDVNSERKQVLIFELIVHILIEIDNTRVEFVLTLDLVPLHQEKVLGRVPGVARGVRLSVHAHQQEEVVEEEHPHHQ